MTEQWDQAFWDERYATSASLWSGEPNRHLVTESENLRPGAALDVGCGEGADAVWLAEQGWQVTGVDISTVALDRARQAAASRDPEVAGRITWLHADLAAWEPRTAAFDLVSVQYFHLPSPLRETAWQRLAAAVAPGGAFLLVAHDPADPHVAERLAQYPQLFFNGDDVVERLAEPEWTIDTNTVIRWTRASHDGDQEALDVVVRATRRPSTP